MLWFTITSLTSDFWTQKNMANIVGTANGDSLTGTSADDSIDGLDGNDVLAGRLGNDTLNGGAGYDAADYFEATGPVTVNLATGTASGADGNDILVSIEDVWGSSFDDVLIGDATDNFLFADLGDDVLAGGPGNDTLSGGAGIDTAIHTGNREAYTLTLIGPGHIISGPDGTDILLDIERLWFADKDLALDLGPGEAAGNTVRIIGAAFGAQNIIPEYVGIGLDLFDGGMSMLDVCQFALGTSLFLSLAGSNSDFDFVNTVYENVVGASPSDAERDFYVRLLVGSGGSMTQAELLMFAADTEANALNIDLVGLQNSGVEFV